MPRPPPPAAAGEEVAVDPVVELKIGGNLVEAGAWTVSPGLN